MEAHWQAGYHRLARSSFATVPLYRELWSPLRGREPGMAGVIHVDEVVRKLIELVPLSGGDAELNPLRGLGPVLRRVRRLGSGALIVVLGRDGGQPRDLSRRLRCRLLDPQTITEAQPVFAELGSATVSVASPAVEMTLADVDAL